MKIHHVVYDYNLLLKIAGPDFNETYFRQFEGAGVESMVKIPKMCECNTDSMMEFEAVRHVAEKGTWPMWLSGIFTQESNLIDILRCNNATEAIDALWEPDVVGKKVASYTGTENKNIELQKLYDSICADKYSSEIFACRQDFHDYVNAWMRPWVFAAKNGYAIGYQSG